VRTTPSADRRTTLCLVAFPLHEANHLLLVDQWHVKIPGGILLRIHHACHVVLHQLDDFADSAPELA